jgi:hypothetical protein
MKEGYIRGDYWMLCDQCALKGRQSEMGQRWDGKWVHKDSNKGCMETRHPQEFVRAVKDPAAPLPVIRPDNDGVYLPFEVHPIIEDAAWAEVPTGTFESTDYDWE